MGSLDTPVCIMAIPLSRRSLLLQVQPRNSQPGIHHATHLGNCIWPLKVHWSHCQCSLNGHVGCSFNEHALMQAKVGIAGTCSRATMRRSTPPCSVHIAEGAHCPPCSTQASCDFTLHCGCAHLPPTDTHSWASLIAGSITKHTTASATSHSSFQRITLDACPASKCSLETVIAPWIGLPLLHQTSASFT